MHLLRVGAERIRRSATHMKALIDDLLDLAKIEAQRFALHLQSVESRVLIDEALLAASPLAEAKRITIAAELIDSPRLEADPERIFRVLSNLLGNAIKFTPEGGTITVRAEQRGDELLITVVDTGPGIAADHLPHVFERYWKARPASAGRSGPGALYRQGNRRGARRTDLGRVLGRRRQVDLHSAPHPPNCDGQFACFWRRCAGYPGRQTVPDRSMA